jgi:quinoprotein glucose dehydrogenase
MKSIAIAAATLLLGLVLIYGQVGPNRQPYTEWRDYGGSGDSMQYSALKQINRSNAGQLEQAWSFPVTERRGDLGFNPVIVDGVMYVVGNDNAILALDGATGKQIWSHPLESSPTARGVNYWENKDRSERRIIFASGNQLQQLDARTGVTINTFGDDGKVDLRKGIERARGIQSGTPGRTFENLIIVGSAPGELYGTAPGDVRAYDIHTGKLVWTFHTIPLKGEFGYDTWPEGARNYVGGVNAWGEISVDEKRGIVYFPLGSGTFDLFGGDRKGDDLFANSLLALDARTGKRLWHFQVVHHDLWDYDLTTAPKLLTVKHDGKNVDVVAQPTKFGLLYVLDRVTGKPLWPVEERPVPQSTVPGEQSSKTQPFPTKPPPYARLKFGPEDINPYLEPEEQAQLREIMKNARNEGIFTPSPPNQNGLTIPGELGGANWGGAAADPTSGMLFVRSADQPSIHFLKEVGPGDGSFEGTPAQYGRLVFSQNCEICHGEATSEGFKSADGASVISIKQIGEERVRQMVRQGRGQMPALPEAELPKPSLDALIEYLQNPEAATAGRGGRAGRGRGGRGGRMAPPPLPAPAPPGITRWHARLGTMWYASNGLSAISPPWGQIVAYDLNQGTIKWKAPLGTVPALAAKGIKNTGNNQRLHRNGLAVTAGGLIFVGTYADRTLRAYDTENGKILWEQAIEANPEGLPAVYQAGGREYVVFSASGSPQNPNAPPSNNISMLPGKIEAQGYYVYALPAVGNGKKASAR